MRERTPDFAKGGLDPKVALDAVFRRNVLTRPGVLALCDPSDRATFTDGLPRRLNYAEADVAVNRLAAQLKALGLPEGSAVALQLSNTVEAPLSLLALLRAGLIAVPVPLLWRRADLVVALREINARAIITMTRIGEARPAEIACEAAAELFSLGFPCAFGHAVPDGVIPLDLDAAIPAQKADLASARISTSEKVAIATFDATRRGAFAVGRTDTQWIAAGLAVMLEARIAPGETIVSTLPPASLAGIASAFLPWLLTGGTLALVHGYSPDAVAHAASGGAHLVAPAPALQTLSEASGESYASSIAVHRGPQSLGIDLSQTNCEAIVDVQSFGEIGLVALRRIAKIMASPVPIGETPATANAPGTPGVIETKRLADGTLAVRGAMVPDKTFPESARADSSQIEFDLDGFVRTNLRCHAIGSSGLSIEASPDGIVAIGGLRYGLDDLTMRVAKASPGSTLATERDSLLGVRLAVESNDPPAARKTLDEAGQSRLIFEGVRPRAAERRAG
jgi:AMP-binding enzyme